MLQIALSQLRSNARRFIAVGLAIMLAVAFLATTLMVNASTKASLTASIGESYRKASLVVTPSSSTPLPDPTVAAALAVPGIEAAYGQQQLATEMVLDGAATSTSGTVLAMVRNAAPPGLESARLASGSMPRGGAEIAVDAKTASRYGIALGSTVHLRQKGIDSTLAVKVTGTLKPQADPFSAGASSVVAAQTVLNTIANGIAVPISTLQVQAAAETVSDSVRGPLTAALAKAGAAGAAITTPEQLAINQVKAMSGGEDQLTIILLAFAVVAMVVAALVVSNTFSVLIAQRTRELALLRCLGAQKNQIRASVLVEATVVGLISSILGVLAGTGLMAALIAWAKTDPERSFATLAVPPSAVIAGLATGTLMAVMAALIPARAATAVAPLAALRPADAPSIGNRAGRFRLGLGILLLVIGVPLLVFGAVMNTLLIALPGGIFSFLGILLCSTLIVPRLVSAVGVLVRPTGVPGRLAALNSIRNPGRTTSTATALLIGVTLVTMMMSGAASSREAFSSVLSQNYPVDMAVQPSGKAYTTAQADAVAKLDGVASVGVVHGAGVGTQAGAQFRVWSMSDADAAAVLRDKTLVVAAGTILLPEGSAPDPVVVEGPGGSVTLKAVVLKSRQIDPMIQASDAAKIASTGTGAGVPPVKAEPSAIAETANKSMLWLELSDSLSTDQMREVQSSVASTLKVSDSLVSGAALERATFNQIIDVLLLVVTALLAVAVVIALIGVANTLSLSVLERTRENSLLRALGLTRGQLRAMLALEGVLIAGVAALLGTVLGVTFGWLGAKSALGALGAVPLMIPVWQLLAVIGVALGAALLASVIPARRASRLSPVAGLATL
ncbi:FtsX-like permease family protein [Pseudarthrobacter sp. J1738]|uniref:FtsX-like permease family protein n=1 Tax=Pseudarthrobacter sp. J1738 TaxID=3420446 RepID=UPI003D29A9C1